MRKDVSLGMFKRFPMYVLCLSVCVCMSVCLCLTVCVYLCVCLCEAVPVMCVRARVCLCVCVCVGFVFISFLTRPTVKHPVAMGYVEKKYSKVCSAAFVCVCVRTYVRACVRMCLDASFFCVLISFLKLLATTIFQAGTELQVEIRNKLRPLTVSKMPFTPANFWRK